jgi:hypothetical protein
MLMPNVGSFYKVHSVDNGADRLVLVDPHHTSHAEEQEAACQPNSQTHVFM